MPESSLDLTLFQLDVLNELKERLASSSQILLIYPHRQFVSASISAPIIVYVPDSFKNGSVITDDHIEMASAVMEIKREIGHDAIYGMMLPKNDPKQHRPFYKNIKGKKSYRDRYV